MNRPPKQKPGIPTDTPAGTPVLVRLDDGRTVAATTRGEPWEVAPGIWIVKTDQTGPSGYDLSRVTPATPR